MPASNGFLYGTVFLAFARFFPDFTIYIMFFVLPVKIRWLALLQWIGYAYGFLFGDWMTKAMIVASVANYLLFFGRDIWLGHEARPSADAVSSAGAAGAAADCAYLPHVRTHER